MQKLVMWVNVMQILGECEESNTNLSSNARASTATPPTIRLFGVPEDFAAFLGLKVT